VLVNEHLNYLKNLVEETSCFDHLLNKGCSLLDETIIPNVEIFNSHKEILFKENDINQIIDLKKHHFKFCTSGLSDKFRNIFEVNGNAFEKLSSKSHCFLVGGDGMGKTTLLKQLLLQTAKESLQKFEKELQSLGSHVKSFSVTSFTYESLMTPVLVTLDKSSVYYLSHKLFTVEDIIMSMLNAEISTILICKKIYYFFFNQMHLKRCRMTVLRTYFINLTLVVVCCI
jgi:hypothetical protein